jgi:hypothetical protein
MCTDRKPLQAVAAASFVGLLAAIGYASAEPSPRLASKPDGSRLVGVDTGEPAPDLAKKLHLATEPTEPVTKPPQARESAKPKPQSAKPNQSRGKPHAAPPLPPGLSRKSKDHPGRVAVLKKFGGPQRGMKKPPGGHRYD